ncbi:Ribosomal protein L34Ae [Corchorus olitorius]|uniref:Ribosomal protein L34Ae n=1 Tax=Corchorus olitorius TaxID=93759 RepID=A0A1R3K4Z2_9ROSI|nr:Ribosomal protein L34Ae [Corchorus olitorius]
MPCSKDEALLRFFYNLSSSSFLLLLFIYTSSILLAKFFCFIGSFPLFNRSQNEYDYAMFSEEEEEEEEEEAYGERFYRVNCMENDHLVADIIHGGESLVFLPETNFQKPQVDDFEEESMNMMNPHEQLTSSEDQEYASYSTEQFSAHDSSPCSDSDEHHDDDDDDDDDDTELVDEEISIKDADDSLQNSDTNQDGPTPMVSSVLTELDKKLCKDQGIKHRVESDFSRNDKFFVIGPTKLESKRLLIHEKDDEEIYGDSCTIGSTSKSSSEWRSSINCRDSGTDDPFSSSSRRSCPKWESYTVFQKYDEEMMFLDRISAQKLQETESLRSIQACPRSISERIIHKFSTMNKKPSDIKHNPYHELESAYVAEICITWEALNWNYKNFERKRAARKDFDCPASIAQQFQQFQVLLQRYIENEPYEQGRRPEVFARMRLLAPKLLQVPEYRDYEDDQNEGYGSRISADSFLVIMEEGIQTFMSFLKADKEKAYQIIKAFFGRKRRGSVDPTLLQLMKKVNAKKKMKLKDLRRAHKCIRKRRMKVEKEMEILMGLIDLKVVSRVLRMSDLTEEQLHWCEEKMSKVRILEGELQRDSSPLFFPAH